MKFNELKSKEVNGKYGWVDNDGNFIIEPKYDSPCAECYNDIVILEKNGYVGGIFLHNRKIAFKFMYRQLGWMYNETFQSINADGTVILIKPGDIIISQHKYSSFYFNDHQRFIRFVRYGLFRRIIEGTLDLETGEEV